MTAISALASAMARTFFEPAVSITDVAERRRTRLLAILELVQIAQCAVSAAVLAPAASGEAAITMPIVLGGAVPFLLVTYALTRTRHAHIGILAHVVLSLALSPLVMFFGQSEPSSFEFFAFMLPPILITSVATSMRFTLASSALSVALMGVVALAYGPPGWATGIGHGVVFLGVSVALVLVLRSHRDRLESDRSSEIRARNGELEALRRTLERRVEERTRELTTRNAHMRLVLDHVAEGLFVVTRAGSFSSGASAAFTRWFGPHEIGESFLSFLGRHAPDYELPATMAWMQVADGMLPLALALDQVPKRLGVGDRFFDLTFEPIGAGEEKLLVVVTDVTSAVSHERVVCERREVLALVEHILADRSQFRGSFEEATALVTRVLEATSESDSLKRELHTLKGNALLLGLESVGATCHQLESRLAEGQPLDHTVERQTLAARWRALEGDVTRLLGNRANVVEVTPEELRALERAAREGRSHDQLLRMITALTLDSVEPRLQRLAEETRRIAGRLGKSVEVRVEVADVLRVDRARWAPLRAALVHVVRNAIDHGIEPPEERRAAGKGERGLVTLSAARAGDVIQIAITDDGRGFDWERLRARAAALGLAVATGDGLEAGLFAEGVSTASEVTELSGRGMGMSALAAAAEEQGGELRVESARGVGTKICLLFPALQAGEPQKQVTPRAAA